MRPILVAIASTLLLAIPLSASGQLSAIVTRLDPSIQSAGMGQATVAVFWQDAPKSWNNPALAAFHRGVRYSYGTTRYHSYSLTDLSFTSHQILVGGYGVGLEVTGKPIDSLGRIRLEYDAIGLDGLVVHRYQEARSIAIGVDFVSLVANLQAARGVEPSPMLRRVSIAMGHAWEDIASQYGPFSETSDAKDMGVLVRVAAIDQVGGVDEASTETRYRLELAGGYSEQNYDKDFSGLASAEHLTRIGASLRITAVPSSSPGGFLRNFLTPSLAFGLAWMVTDRDYSLDRHHYGAEASLWDILFVRGGLDDVGSDRLATFGGGIALTYRKAIGVRFDYAWQELSGDSDDMDRYQATAFVDPVRLWRDVKQP